MVRGPRAVAEARNDKLWMVALMVVKRAAAQAAEVGFLVRPGVIIRLTKLLTFCLCSRTLKVVMGGCTPEEFCLFGIKRCRENFLKSQQVLTDLLQYYITLLPKMSWLPHSTIRAILSCFHQMEKKGRLGVKLVRVMINSKPLCTPRSRRLKVNCVLCFVLR